MTKAEEVIFFGGSHINSRFQVGRLELINCQPLDIERQVIKDFIGSLEPVSVKVKRDDCETTIKSIQIDHQLITWEAK